MKRVPFSGIVCSNPKEEAKEEKVSEYIVWNPDSNLPVRVRHTDRGTAIRVAGRMAHENPGKTFYVAKLVNSAMKPVPVEVNYSDLERG